MSQFTVSHNSLLHLMTSTLSYDNSDSVTTRVFPFQPGTVFKKDFYVLYKRIEFKPKTWLSNFVNISPAILIISQDRKHKEIELE